MADRPLQPRGGGRPGLLLALAFTLLCAACFNPFAPELERSAGNGLRITGQSTPAEVLDNFVYA